MSKESPAASSSKTRRPPALKDVCLQCMRATSAAHAAFDSAVLHRRLQGRMSIVALLKSSVALAEANMSGV